MKKGVYSPTIVVLTFVVLVYATGLIYMDQNKYSNVFGKTQSDIINAYREGEKLKFYVDEAAKLSRDEAIFELGQKGGNYECNECYLNINPEENFIKIFKDRLRRYNIYNYEISIEDNNVIGKEKDKQKIDIDVKAIKENLGKEYSTKGTYYFDTSFKVDLDYNFKIYKEINDKLKEIKNCIEDINEGDCIENWKIERGNIVTIEVNTGKKVLNNFKLEEVKIRFNYKRG